jgi:DNA polymerase I
MAFKSEFEGGVVHEWSLTDSGATERVVTDYTPTMYVEGADDALTTIADALARDPKVARTRWERWFTGLASRDRTRVLRIDLERMDEVRTLAREIRRLHEFERLSPGALRLYNVDLSPQFRYCLEIGRDPTPPREPRCLSLHLPERSLVEGDITALTVDGDCVGATAAAVLEALGDRLRTDDPDVLVVTTGEVVPALFRAADSEASFTPDFRLGRRDGWSRLAGASTYHSYGQVGHAAARYDVPGRAIVDTSNSFLWGKSGLPGVLDLIERSWKPIQETAWASIGNVLTAIQTREALSREVLVPWNKWDPERFKPVETLHAADRGGFVFEPAVGVHEEVVEVDFASLYPTIMCRFNISPETVGCDCHDDETVPGLGYSICERRGFLPDVLQPLVDDRAGFKRAIARTDDEAERTRLQGRADALKWVLVCCFGYQGYRNAKFGRIECHEAINAYAREILLAAKAALEAGGWRVLHGITDSLWVTAARERPVPIDDVARTVSADVGIDLEVESRFDWVAFVPTRDQRRGALTKYFGKRSTADIERGEAPFKVRGIEARQRSTPSYVRALQEDLLAVFDEHRTPEAVCDRARRAIADLEAGRVDPASLVVTTRVSGPAEEYTRRSAAVAALERATELGFSRSPGQAVRYVVVADDDRSPERVRLAVESPATYDPAPYVELVLRATESVVAPLGWDRSAIRRHLATATDLTLTAF